MFPPLSSVSLSASEGEDLVAEMPPTSKKAKRKLHVDVVEVSKSAISGKGKKQKLATPAASPKSVRNISTSKAKIRGDVVLSSSASSTTKKQKERRYKCTAPAPLKKHLAPRASPNSKKQAPAGKSLTSKSQKNVGDSPTPMSSLGETVFVLMVHSIRYVSALSSKDVERLYSREIRAEKKVNPTMFVTYGLDVLLKEIHLWSSLTNVFPFNENVVREFYANLQSECGIAESPRFGKVFVRGFVFSFTPELINDLFSLPSIEIPDWCLDRKIEQ